LILWPDGTIVWRCENEGVQSIDKYRIGRIGKERVDEVISEILQKGEKNFNSDGFRPTNVSLDLGYYDESIGYTPEFRGYNPYEMRIILPDFFFKCCIRPSITEDYMEVRESLKDFNKEERVALIKKMLRPIGGIPDALLRDFNIIPKIERTFPPFALSSDEIDTIAPYIFGDLDFFLSCRDTILSLIPAGDEGVDVIVKFPIEKDNLLIVTVFYEDGKLRYEYLIGTLAEAVRLGDLFRKKRERQKNATE